MRNRGEIVAASYFQLRGEKKDDHLASKRVSKHGFTFRVINLLCLLNLIKHR